ncbi:MAG: PmoA family protein [Planctomycetaceae bacterium]|nr:PmoA family protein [Planctomycetaceae bacterium]
MSRFFPLFLLLLIPRPTFAGELTDELPLVPEGFTVDVIATEPLVSNPCVMAFDRQGRLFVAQGPQWRGPTPETPGDKVVMLIDEDGDGRADRTHTFAKGFNCIQGIAFRGNELWVANAPDLTVVRDLDGDNVGDEYVRLYTGLGNLEHSLHGLNFGPDGKLYMSKGNSKGYNTLDQLAPKPFRELWGVPDPPGAPDMPEAKVFTPETYQRAYHTPQDDWGQTGGILRCDRDGSNLEIVCRGFRNPWDICYDDGFNWLGTDNDQSEGDKIFAPFHGAHFGWGHPWSYHWTGEDHLPTVPASAPLFEGSGAGVIHYHARQYPAEYRDLFFINDWMRREIYAFRPEWDGALLKCVDGFPGVFAHAEGGRSLPESSGRVFEPTDIEVGPDGALYVLSWGHGYGGTLQNGEQTDKGRVYRIRYTGNPLETWQSDHRSRPHSEWKLSQLFADLGSSVPAWRIDAQDELLHRGDKAYTFLQQQWLEGELTQSQRTWTLWTLGRFPDQPQFDEQLTRIAASQQTPLTDRIQVVRILAHRIKEFQVTSPLPQRLVTLLEAPEPRLRQAVALAIEAADDRQKLNALLNRVAVESDRVTYYSLWQAIKSLGTLEQRKAWLTDSRPAVRLAALLGLFHDGLLSAEEAMTLRSDDDPRVAALVNDWLQKTGNASPLVEFSPPPGEYHEPIQVSLKSHVAGAFLTYSLDGSKPTFTSPRVQGPISIDGNRTLNVSVNGGATNGQQLVTAEYTIKPRPRYRHRAFIRDVRTPSRRHYELDWFGVSVGKRHYTDRDYIITDVPAELKGMPFLRVANNDDRSIGEDWLRFIAEEDVDVLVGVDIRNNAPLAWMHIGEPNGFTDTGLELVTTDPTFRIYRKSFPAGEIILGGNTNRSDDSGRGNYIVLFDRELLHPSSKSVTLENVLARMPTADPERGRELFLHPKGAGCVKCHQLDGFGSKFAPDLTDIGSRARKPEIIIKSILNPSEVITEGFAQQTVVTSEGKTYTGAVIQETGLSLTLITPKAEPIEIRKEEIEERIGSKLSPMPSGFDKLMSAQQLADLTSWLLTKTVIGDRKGFWLQDSDNKLEIHYADQNIATYLKHHDRLTRPAFVNVKLPSGIQVTRNFPPRKPEDIDPGYNAEDGIIHPVMHPGLWIGYGDIDGNDYWRLQARVEFVEFVESPIADRDTASFTIRNRYRNEADTETVCEELVRYNLKRIEEGIVFEIEATYRSDKDFYFGDQEESGLGLRVASPIRVQGGNGTILNNRGEKNGAEVWGKEAQWFDYFGTIDNQQVGAIVIPNAKNPRPSWLHARDYGVIVTNPFPKQPKERREPYVKTPLKAGERFRLGWTVILHESPANQPFDRKSLIERVTQD